MLIVLLPSLALVLRGLGITLAVPFLPVLVYSEPQHMATIPSDELLTFARLRINDTSESNVIYATCSEQG